MSGALNLANRVCPRLLRRRRMKSSSSIPKEVMRAPDPFVCYSINQISIFEHSKIYPAMPPSQTTILVLPSLLLQGRSAMRGPSFTYPLRESDSR